MAEYQAFRPWSAYIHPCPGPGVVSINLTAGGPAAELHTPPAGFRRCWVAEQLAPQAVLCGLALMAADLAAHRRRTTGAAPKAGSRVAEIHTQPSNFRRGRIAPTPSENCGSAPRASGLAAEIHAPPTGFRRGKLAEQLALPEDCGSAPIASSLATENHKPTASSVCSTVKNGTDVKPRNLVF
ncbi:hypothetical protein NQZ68_032191 [Dissostichus eleginoides]|nr:hypothetical protein NQZ68_032191 [Dissostichus eleginoides]